MKDKYITVTQLTRYIKYKIDNDSNLNEVFLKGEISNFKAHSRGHFYFTLKDEGSRINAIMFASNTKKIKFTPEEGMKVLITGKISVFESTGQYQIYVDDMEEDGIGNLYIAYEQLKKKLQEEGLFREEHKKPIKKFPTTIGVVTAPTGAAIKDIISTIKRRWPLTKIFLFPSLVQGEDAKEDIVRQIKRADSYNLDTLIVGRGGGSIEDLWAFNEEIVARAIYDCKTPVISAVGHEIDFTIADFVADMRAPTPTGAAEMAVPQLSEVINYTNQLRIRLNNNIINKIKNCKRKLHDLKTRNVLIKPINIFQTKEIQFSNCLDKLKYNIINLVNIKEKDYSKLKNSYILQKPYQLLDKKSNKYLQIISKLETLSPLLTLQRGYTMTKKNDKIISSTKDIKVEDILEINFKDGNLLTKVIKKD